VSKSKKISVDKVYVVHLSRKNIWEISDALKSLPKEKRNPVLVRDFGKFEQKISEYLNKEIEYESGNSKM